MARRRHELLQDVQQSAEATAAELGVAGDVAAQLGAAVADMLLERWAGQQITFPVNGYYGLSGRELAIVARRQEGARVFELAREFRMTERGIRKLLARVEAGRARISSQLDLFGGNSLAAELR
jgi:Mor family transcriptional regulator